MKQCCRCKEVKSLEEFNKKTSNKDGLERYCKDCHRSKNRNHYNNNKQRYVEQALKYKREYVAWYKAVKAELRCERCGEDHPATLDFHHPDPSIKEGEVSQMIASMASKQTVLEEINKCIVLCSNCHRKEHYIP